MPDPVALCKAEIGRLVTLIRSKCRNVVFLERHSHWFAEIGEDHHAITVGLTGALAYLAE